MSNVMHVIYPENDHSGGWHFSDQRHNLVAEPFVLGTEKILTDLVQKRWRSSHVPKFRLTFSEFSFPGVEAILIREYEEYGGWWYRLDGTQELGWLCPAMFHYFKEAPARIFLKLEE